MKRRAYSKEFKNEINLTNDLDSVLKDIDVFVIAVPTSSY